MKMSNHIPIKIWIGKRKKSRKGKIAISLGIFFSVCAGIFVILKLMKKI